ncbi:MAG: hypothetical protein U0169_16085 [Polyangiaceae bacterium]
MANHYDAVIVGSGTGALVAAAILARRTWRVLLVGQGRKPPTYHHEGLVFARRTFAFGIGATASWANVLGELAERNGWKRRVATPKAAVQFVTGDVRLDLSGDDTRFLRDLERAYGAEATGAFASVRAVEEVGLELDTLVSGDPAFLPSTKKDERDAERRLAGAFASAAPAAHRPWGSASLRRAMEVYVSFASHLRSQVPPVAFLRLAAAVRQGTVEVQGGEAGLVDFLVERARAHGADVKLDAKLVEVVHERGRVTKVILDDGTAPAGADYVVTDLGARELALHASSVDPDAVRELPVLHPTSFRAVVNVVLRREAVPVPLGTDAFLLPNERKDARAASPVDTRVPDVRVQRVPAPAQVSGSDDGVTLAVELLASDARDAPVTSANVRDRALEAVVRTFPFAARHVLAVDSPHDGKPLWDYRNGTRVLVERALLQKGGATKSTEPRAIRFETDRTWFHGLAVDAVPGAFKNAFHVGRSVLPTLGTEGEVLAALAALRILRGLEPKKESIGADFRRKVAW